MSLIGLFKPKGKSGFGYTSTAEEVTAGIDLKGKTILITGCNSGLGRETARVLALRGARIVGTARSIEKAEGSLIDFGSNHLGYACELSDPKSVRTCVAALKKEGLKFDAVICNAGIMALPNLEQSHGYELQFFTNHIGHFILVTGILSLLADNGRVVMLSSSAHTMAPKAGIEFDNLSGEVGYKAWKAYGQSKLANLLFAKELSRRFAGTKKTANAVHPGVIRTNLGRHMPAVANAVFAAVGPIFLKSVAQGAATQCYVAVHADNAAVNGQYFADVNVAKPRNDAEDSAMAKRLWDVSEQIVANL